tara:strand:+ start:304 stop:828 length:525 start_codon:yes stop_codon:yes gene_type:complete
MSTGILRNPNGAHRTVSDFTTGQDDDGVDLALSDQSIETFKAGGTVIKGQALMLVAPTTTAGPTVVAATTAVMAPNADNHRFCGVALNAGAAGDQIQVGTQGIFRVLHDASDDPAAYDLLVAPQTTDGDFDVVAGTPVDDTVVVGYFLGGTDAGTVDTALAFIGPVTVRFATTA